MWPCVWYPSLQQYEGSPGLGSATDRGGPPAPPCILVSMRCSLFIALLCFSLAAAAPVVTNCPYDRPTAPEWEVFAFVLDNNWTALDWSCVTTVAWFGAADPAVSDVCLAHSHGARVVIHSDLNAIPGGSINNATARTAGVQALLATATRLSIDGVNLDIEGYTGSKASLTAYVQELAAAFRAALPTSQLSFDLAVLPNGQAQYYDHAALAEVLDFLVPMAYDEASPPCVPDCTVQWPLSMSSTFPDPTHWLSDHDSGLRCSLHYRQDWGSLTPEVPHADTATSRMPCAALVLGLHIIMNQQWCWAGELALACAAREREAVRSSGCESPQTSLRSAVVWRGVPLRRPGQRCTLTSIGL